jgi:hypothetical protein
MLDAALQRLNLRKPAATALFVVVLLAGSTVFGFTAAGHYSTFETGRVTGTTTGYAVDDGGTEPVLVVDVRVDNPLLRPITVTNAGLTARADGTVVATSGGILVDSGVDAGGSSTITIPLRPENGEAERMRTAAANGNLVVTGSVRATIEAAEFNFGVQNSTRGGAGE